jgi:hypothetical protein
MGTYPPASSTPGASNRSLAPTYYNGNSIRIKCTFWYSAAAGKVVKLVMTTESGYSVVQGTETYELTAYERGGG